MADRRVDTGIIQRGDTYRFTVALGIDKNGKQIRKTTTFTPPEGMSQGKADKLAKEEYVYFKNRCKGLLSFNVNYTPENGHSQKLYPKIRQSIFNNHKNGQNPYLVPEN